MVDHRDEPAPIISLYRSLIELSISQVNAQLAHADTLNLQSIGILAVEAAVIAAAYAVRSVATTSFSWWWLPLLAFAPSVIALVLPLRGPGNEKRSFLQGPRIPNILGELHSLGDSGQVTLEESLILVLQGLEQAWRQNDDLLRAEERHFRVGLVLFGLASALTLGLYAWQLG